MPCTLGKSLNYSDDDNEKGDDNSDADDDLEYSGCVKHFTYDDFFHLTI